MNRFGSRSRLAAASALALLLAACDEDSGGRVDAPDPMPLAQLAPSTDLPFAEPSPVDYYAPSDGYPWAERAYGMQRAVYDSPPDYGFAYEDEEWLAWETADEGFLYAEPWDDGYRYYYYEPGAAYPYFVRDADYGYAYGAAGVLIAVFDARGRYLPSDVVYRVAPTAGRYYARGHHLRSAATPARRVRVSEQAWSVRAPRVEKSAAPWMQAAREEPRWRAWRESRPKADLRRVSEDRGERGRAQRAGKGPPERLEPAAERFAGTQARRDDDRRAPRADRVRADERPQQVARAEPGPRAQAAATRRVEPDARRIERPAQAQPREAVRERQQARNDKPRQDRPQPQARAADQQGKPAAAQDRGKGHGKKD